MTGVSLSVKYGKRAFDRTNYYVADCGTQRSDF